MDSEERIDQALLELKRRLTSLLKDRLKQIVVYGSRARGDYDNGSDIDVAVIVEGLDRELQMQILDEVADVELEYTRPLSTLVLSEQTYSRLLRRERRIALDIKNEGIPL